MSISYVKEGELDGEADGCEELAYLAIYNPSAEPSFCLVVASYISNGVAVVVLNVSMVAGRYEDFETDETGNIRSASIESSKNTLILPM